MPRRLLIPALLALAAAMAGALTGVTGAGFTSETSNAGNTLTAMKVFPGQRFASTWRVSDVTSGTAVSRTDQLAFADGTTLPSGAFGTAFSATRYLETSLAGPLPEGGTVTSATLNLRFAAPSGTACVYVELLRRSTGATVATYGSAAAPLACNATTTLANGVVAQSLSSAVTSTAMANDLKVRIYGRSTTSAGLTVDQIAASASTAHQTAELLPTETVDRSTGVAGTPWAAVFAKTDATTAQNATLTTGTGWAATYSAAQYLELRFAALVPAGADITAGELRHTYRIGAGGGQLGSTCLRYEFRAAGAAIGPVVNPGTCSASNTVDQTDVVPLPALTAAQANDLSVRISGTSTRTRTTTHDLASLALTWSLK